METIKLHNGHEREFLVFRDNHHKFYICSTSLQADDLVKTFKEKNKDCYKEETAYGWCVVLKK